MIPATLARRYARALIQLADSPMQREIFGRDLAAFVRTATAKIEGGEGDATLLSVLDFGIHPQAERRQVLDAVLKRMNLDATVVKFLQLVFERGRIGGIPQIGGAFAEMADTLAGRQKATVTSARPLAADSLAKLKASLERVTGKTILVDTKIDPSLLGGVVAQVGTYVFDGSLKSQLERMRTALRS
jgi:F-type H+-transporting ATPase subunit delta